MSADEYRIVIAALSLNLAQAARLLGVDYSTSRRWADGRREVSPTAARFLRFMVAEKITPEEVHRALGEKP